MDLRLYLLVFAYRWQCSGNILLSGGHHHPVRLVAHSDMAFLVPFNDQIIGPLLISSGTFDNRERDILLQITRLGDVVVEVGSNLGPYTVYIADRVGESGLVFCFEPFRLLYQLLTTNVALNGLSNVVTVNSGVGDWPERFAEAQGPNLNQSDNYGASTLLEGTRRTWILSNPVPERIKVIPLDSFSFETDRIDLLKIDAEGMEYEVLSGAANLVRKYHPILYVENNVAELVTGFRFEEWVSYMFGYSCIRPEILLEHDIVICHVTD